jgi:hypothetical protein
MKMKVSLVLFMAGFPFVSCKHDNNKLGEGSTVSFNPVGAWAISSTPLTYHQGTCLEAESWFNYSDTMTVTLNGSVLNGNLTNGFLYGASSAYSGSFSNNAMTLQVIPGENVAAPFVSNRSFKVPPPSAPDNFSDNLFLSLSSDTSASGSETWSVRYGTQSCGGTNTVIATKH